MKIKATVIFGLLAGFILVGYAFKKYQNAPNPEKDSVLIKTILSGLERWHFFPKKIDDKLSTEVFDLYLDNLDGSRRLFTESDIAALRVWRLKIDDESQAGTFQFFTEANLRYDAALTKTEAWYTAALIQPMDFSAKESIAMGEDLEWAADDAELESRWKKLMKYEVLNHIYSEMDKQSKEDYKGDVKTKEELEKEGREKTKEKYDKWYKRLRKADHDKKMEGYLNAITSVFDPHTGYFSPKDKEAFDIQMSGKLEGIGARLQSDGEKTTVTEIVVGGPAWKQGELEAKDVIEKVAQEGEEPMDVMGLEIDDVVSKIRGPKNTNVYLTVRKADGSVKIIKILRDVVIMEEGFAKSLIINENNADKIGYIYLPKFYADFTPQGTTSCAVDVEKEINKLKAENVKGIILDLRGNSGGSLRDVIRMSGYFIEKGPIVQVKSRDTRPEIGDDRDTRVQYAGPLVVMVNQFSASASEILAAAMQDYKRAVIVGASASYGKGTVQRFINLDDYAEGNSSALGPLGEMKITLQKFYRITGRTTQNDGVIPDIILADNYNYLEIGEKENEYPLPSTTIEAVRFEQKVNVIPNIAILKEKSAKRTATDPTLQMIETNAKRLKAQRDEKTYPLNYDEFVALNKTRKAESDKFEDMLKPIETFSISNVAVDLPSIQSDTSKIARNDSWLKERKKDIQLYEALRVMYDMIELNPIANKN